MHHCSISNRSKGFCLNPSKVFLSLKYLLIEEHHWWGMGESLWLRRSQGHSLSIPWDMAARTTLTPGQSVMTVSSNSAMTRGTMWTVCLLYYKCLFHCTGVNSRHRLQCCGRHNVWLISQLRREKCTCDDTVRRELNVLIAQAFKGCLREVLGKTHWQIERNMYHLWSIITKPYISLSTPSAPTWLIFLLRVFLLWKMLS